MTSLRHPNVSLEDTVAIKLGVLLGLQNHQMSLAKELVADLRELVRQDAVEAISKPELPETVLDEKDLRYDVYGSGMRDWSLALRHIPSGIVVERNSDAGWKSQLQAKVNAVAEMEGRVRTWLSHG